ncbi:membrane protein YqaA, SNARE-associated domain [Malonomonas rubra DSM 5091]|uniref:Membrane protein YqaA, SNARE-associated domain n=1 Tax=Malonomonas rubra DSM 5091 TaxID=1122189 RepID=A0A1M6HK90_MALRU|nr:YqaA family protein [Malonomonas rubra]SHJ22588.1 membrane protein YqaA, SNARE-associated domain [Malonomonas rubra DSM 5091]
MPELLTEYGLLSLFLLSFCAATLLPLGSEWFLVVLLLEGVSPLSTVAVATLGNSLGAATNYLIGRWGGDWLLSRLLRIDTKQQQRAEIWFNRYGSWALLLAWLPIVGDPLCVVSGSLKTPLLRFALLVTIGKGARYTSLAFLTLQGISSLS